MPNTLESVMAQAADLSPLDRAALAAYLESLESLDAGPFTLTPEQHAEFDRRRAAFESGAEPGRPVEDVIAELRRRFA